MFNKIIFISLQIIAALFSSVCFACPDINKIPDFNCDGKIQIAIVGDSLVSGFGDTKNGNKGGYVLRAAQKLPNINLVNLGKAGLRTKELLQLINNAFSKGKDESFKNGVEEADVVILDIGRNDRWLFGLPLETYRNIKRARTLIKNKLKKEGKIEPLIVTAVMMLPNRGSQGPWVKELDDIILKNNSTNEPADLRFDKVSKRLLSSDQIHPTSEGYSQLAKTLVTYITKSLPGKMRKLRPDTDGDKIPDLIEQQLFGTDPANPDSDLDGKSDYDEIFVLSLNPLVAD